jgi:hypothetical protein
LAEEDDEGRRVDIAGRGRATRGFGVRWPAAICDTAMSVP